MISALAVDIDFTFRSRGTHRTAPGPPAAYRGSCTSTKVIITHYDEKKAKRNKLFKNRNKL